MSSIAQDARYGLRLLARSPGFTLVAVLSLSLGIGANTAIFSLVNTVLLRPFPVHRPDQLVSLTVQSSDGSPAAFSYPDYLDFRDRNEALAGLYASRITPMSLSQGGNNERVWGYEVTGNYFEVLGIDAIRGRTFTPDEDRVKLSSPVVVISYACWQNRFGGDPAVVDRDVSINGHTFKILGVTPKGFSGTELIITPEIFVPMTMQEWIEPGNNWLDRRSTHNIFATGRLRDEISLREAEASLNVLSVQLGQEYPDTNEGTTIQLTKPGFVLPSIRDAFVTFSAILLAVVSLVLLIACTNLASLMLARAAARRKEIAIRLSLGATRRVLIRQLLTESLLLSAIGGAVGLILAVWIIDAVVAFKPPIDVPISLELGLDWRVLVFSVGVSALTSLLFGLLPAMQATKPDIVTTLKSETSIGGYRRSRLRNGLVVAQIALSLVLLVAAGLVLRSLGHLQTMDVGFRVENGLIMSFDIGLQGYDQARGQQFQDQLLERVRSLPGVKAASLTDLLPLSLNYSNNAIFVEGQPVERGAKTRTAMLASVASDYFAAMGTSLVAGREIDRRDHEKAPRVVVVNESFVRRFLPNAQSMDAAIGRRFSYRGGQGPWIEIVGVARDGKYWNITEDEQPFVFNSLPQSYNSFATLVVRAEANPQSLVAPIGNEFRRLDGQLPVFGVKTLEEHLGFSLFPARVAATLLAGFGLVALALAAIGIYGVMAYSVAHRTREIGIRMAIGAQQADVLKLVMKQSLVLVAVGVALGLIGAFAATRFMADFLYGVSTTDAATFGAITALLVGVAIAASYLPARRAAGVDPMIALRYE